MSFCRLAGLLTGSLMALTSLVTGVPEARAQYVPYWGPVFVPPQPVFVPRPVFIPPPVFQPDMLPTREPAPMDRPTRRTVEVFSPEARSMGGGVAIPGAGLTVIDPATCAQNPAACVFIRFHEQGHHEVGMSEQAADCYAARNAPTYAVRAAISQFMQNPYFGDAQHGTGAQRASLISECFNQRLAADSASQAAASETSAVSDTGDTETWAECRRDARREFEECSGTCRELYDDVTERRDCRKDCRESRESAYEACGDL